MKNLAILSFLFILVASLSLGIPYADAGSKESKFESGEEADNSDLENEESPDTASDETIDSAISGRRRSHQRLNLKIYQTVKLTNLLLPYLKICLILQQVPQTQNLLP